MFGSSQQTASPGAGGGLFGQQPQTPGFGQQPQTPGFGQQGGGGGLFGAKPAGTTAGGGLFGSTPQQPNMGGGGLFGNQSSTAAGGSPFGAAPNSGGGLFGAKPAGSPLAGGGLFGSQPQQQQNTTGGGGFFGGASGGLGGSSTLGGGGLFGSQPSQQQQQTGGGLFGSSQQQGGGSAFGGGGGGLFGGANASGTNTTTGGGGLFGNTQQSSGQQTPGGGLFGGGLSTGGGNTGGLFGGGGGGSSIGGGTTPGGGLFGAKPAGGSLFGQQPSSTFGGGSGLQLQGTGGGLFGGGAAGGTGGGLFGNSTGGGGMFQQNLGQQPGQQTQLFQQQNQQVSASPYGAQLSVPNAAALVPGSSAKPRQSLLGDAIGGSGSLISRSTASALATFPARPQTPRAPWLLSRGATPGANGASSQQKAVVLSRREYGGGGAPTYLDKRSHDAYEIAQPERKLDADRDQENQLGLSRKESPASGWLFKPREDPRALFIRPSNTLGGGSEGLSGISLATYANGKAASQRDQRLGLPILDEDSGLTILPTMDELRELVEKRGPEALTCVQNFSITDKEFGKVEWLEPVDISRIDIGRVVKFEKACLCLYPEDAGVEAPETGAGLKKRALVTLTGVKPRKATAAAKKRYQEKIESQTIAAGGELVSYDPDVGDWKFKLQL